MAQTRPPTAVYTPHVGLDVSWHQAVVALVRDLWTYRWQIWVGFKRNFVAQTRTTALGVVWSFVLPLLPISVFVFLKSLRVFPSDDAIHPTVYVTIGMTIWLLVSGAITAPMQALQRERAMLVRSHFPIAGAALVSYGQVLFETLVRLAATIPVVLWFSGVPPLAALAAPFLLLPPILLGCGLGLFLAVASVVSRDVENTTTVILRYLLFMSFVIFPLPDSFVITSWLYYLNPFAILIDNMRSLIVLGQFASPLAYAMVTVLSVAVFIVACRVLYATQERIRGFL